MTQDQASLQPWSLVTQILMATYSSCEEKEEDVSRAFSTFRLSTFRISQSGWSASPVNCTNSVGNMPMEVIAKISDLDNKLDATYNQGHNIALKEMFTCLICKKISTEKHPGQWYLPAAGVSYAAMNVFISGFLVPLCAPTAGAPLLHALLSHFSNLCLNLLKRSSLEIFCWTWETKNCPSQWHIFILLQSVREGAITSYIYWYNF